MEYYSNAYQYLKQKKMLSYLEMKTSGDLSWTDKIDPGVSPTQALSLGMKSSEEMAVQEKLGKIRAKLQSGARLTGAEKEYLKKHDPQLYSKVMALEEEEEAYAERLKQSRTRNDAERAKTEKLAELAANMKKEDAAYMLARLNRMREVEKKLASVILRKPWQQELDRKRLEIYKKNRKKEDEKIKKKKAEKKRREEAARKKRAEEKRREEAYRKKKMEEKIRQEAAQKEAIRRQMIEREKVKELMEERQLEEERIEDSVVSERMTESEMSAEQIAKFMIAAGMMDEKAKEVRAFGQAEGLEDSIPSVPSLGSSSGYAAYRAAAYMPELADQQKEKKSCIRRA